ncbi:hypothetical protein Patl1_18710 [Pistacia atlantica]|uniref:Uncharacterized protein n=1 Tax=Pistacia atlantica TaxID=434234 RepID=A0ACC1C1Y4_9ROSI|nr:hypothetical protein Patl1_18710 [Pistacia atlantica]
MKEDSDVLAIACRPMANVSPVTASSLAHQPFPTPSPFSFSVASTGWSSRPSIHYTNLGLRFSVLLFSFVSAISLAIPSKKKNQPSSFTAYPELMYCFTVHILAFLYTSFQLFKGICDIAHRGFLISDMISDYMSFILDQLVGYLLISASSVAIPVILQIEKATPLWTAAIISNTMSFVTFLVIGICTLLSGYKLCKRIIW